MVYLFILMLGIPANAGEKLNEQGFVIVPTLSRNIYDIYESAKKANEPILVTQDVLLHTSHIMFDYTLRILELEVLLPKLKELTKGMLSASISQANAEKSETIKLAIYDNLAFFGVAGKILGIDLPENIPEEVNAVIDLEYKLIEACRGPVASELFGYNEDYTQYITRGHYTRNVDFEHYFKAMMWYGRMGFYIEPDPSMYLKKIDPIQEGIKLTRRAILITKIINSSPKLSNLWDEIYKPTTFFAGKADDFTIKDYQSILGNVDPSKDNSILSFIKRAKKLPGPRIVSVVVDDREPDKAQKLKGFRFMGQRFIPDSYIFQNLTYPKVKKYLGNEKPFTLVSTPAGPVRCFPRGLDVMFVFGNETAGDILKTEGDTEYEEYENQIKKLKLEFSNLPQSQWSENLYWGWLHILKKLVTHQHKGYPEFMQSKQWKLKQLNAVLGSWTELRHDTILYGKQSYTLLATGMPATPQFTKGWVEPYPEIYKLMSKLITGISNTAEYPQEVENKLNEFAKVLAELSIISDKELKDELLTEEEYTLIWNIGSNLKNITQFSQALMQKITSGADEVMAIVADVHTDPNSGKVLEEAVGYPSEIYVKLSGSKIVKGGVFSYYEFKAPMEERYTDEKWQEELRSTKPQELQKWIMPLLKNESE